MLAQPIAKRRLARNEELGWWSRRSHCPEYRAADKGQQPWDPASPDRALNQRTMRFLQALRKGAT
jgi:hypothetical protein